MARKKKDRLDTEALYAKLKYKHLLSCQSLTNKYPSAVKLLASGAIAGTLLLSSPRVDQLIQPQTPDTIIMQSTQAINHSLAAELDGLLPEKNKSLTPDQESKISHLLYNYFGIQAVPQLGSTRLNHVYGLIGAEQHLQRYPGDTLNQHDDYLQAGIAPGLGGWGYFARSKKEMSREDYLKEKYYVAVQTLYLPDWRTRTKFLSQWYKHRKVAVINPVNGKVLIAVVADAGPSWWTGKHFGGSPEVMAYLELNVGRQKGPVFLYFVDDPENKVALGPLEKEND